jgi:probable HAF family extracellular repeat protein
MRRSGLLLIVAGVILGGSCALAQAGTLYHLTDIGTLGGPGSQALGINNNGQVVGYSSSATDGNPRALLFSGGVLTDLGQPYGSLTYASAINDSGQIVGFASDTTFTGHPFLYANGTFVDLSSTGVGSVSAINASAVIVGSRNEGPTIYDYNTSVLTVLPTFGGSTGGASAINDNGQVVGSSRTGATDGAGQPVRHAFLYSNGTMTDLGGGFFPGTSAGAVAVNPTGTVIAGSADTGLYFPGFGTPHHAYAYYSGAMHDLGTLGGTTSSAYAINASDQIVGYADGAGGSRAFLYEAGVMRDLNTMLDASGSGWLLTQANDINDSGWIVGGAIAPNGKVHGFLLTPQTPEPSFLGIAGVLALFGTRRICRPRLK